jgi:Protein of unknown function (DUF1348)
MEHPRPHRVSLAYTPDSLWRNRDQFITGREEIVAFLTTNWERELDYVLRKSLWGFRENRMAVRFQYEWHDLAGQWFRLRTVPSPGARYSPKRPEIHMSCQILVDDACGLIFCTIERPVGNMQ